MLNHHKVRKMKGVVQIASGFPDIKGVMATYVCDDIAYFDGSYAFAMHTRIITMKPISLR